MKERTASGELEKRNTVRAGHPTKFQPLPSRLQRSQRAAFFSSPSGSYISSKRAKSPMLSAETQQSAEWTTAGADAQKARPLIIGREPAPGDAPAVSSASHDAPPRSSSRVGDVAARLIPAGRCNGGRVVSRVVWHKDRASSEPPSTTGRTCTHTGQHP